MGQTLESNLGPHPRLLPFLPSWVSRFPDSLGLQAGPSPPPTPPPPPPVYLLGGHPVHPPAPAPASALYHAPGLWNQLPQQPQASPPSPSPPLHRTREVFLKSKYHGVLPLLNQV